MLPAWLGWETALSKAWPGARANCWADARAVAVLPHPHRHAGNGPGQGRCRHRRGLRRASGAAALACHWVRTCATYCRRHANGAGPDRAVAATGTQPDTLEFIRLRNTYLDPLHLLQAELLALAQPEAALDSPLEQALLVSVAGLPPVCATPAEVLPWAMQAMPARATEGGCTRRNRA
jgi:phosphoenolpyruvate carboxylase